MPALVGYYGLLTLKQPSLLPNMVVCKQCSIKWVVGGK